MPLDELNADQIDLIEQALRAVIAQYLLNATLERRRGRPQTDIDHWHKKHQFALDTYRALFHRDPVSL